VKPQSWKKVLITGTALAMLTSSACAKLSETEKYAKQFGLPREVTVLVKELDYFDPNTQSLLSQLYYLPKELQAHEVTLDYLKEITKDKKVSNEELNVLLRDKLDHDKDGLDLALEKELKTDPLKPDPEIKRTVDTLKSLSDDTLKAYIKLGIDTNVIEYVDFVKSLPKADFADYALKQKLCIQDRKLTEEEEKFLHDPNKYIQEIYEYNISEIATIDPELPIKLKQMPFLQDGIELKDVESLEDILYLASNPQNQSKLEKIYGKGIERNMWPVALERVFYKGFETEFDINNPFEGSEWYVNSNLAEFQEKYNKEMDQEGIPGPKPAIVGINLVEEPQGWVIKSEQDNKLDYALIKWVLKCNAVRLYGHNDFVFHHIVLAQNEGLDVYLQFDPVSPANFENVNLSSDLYEKQLVIFAKKAQEYNVKWLSVGYELELWWKILGSEGNWGWNDASFASRQNSTVDRVVKELGKIARENYSGIVTYADWYASQWGFQQLNWHNVDIISMNMYLEQNRDELLIPTIKSLKQNYNKPYIISETGSLTITEAENTGGDDSYTWRYPVHYDQGTQAKKIDRTLNLIYKAKVDGVFIYSWDRNANFHDQNKLGFGIWDYVKKEPKLSFWTVYKYYKE
jgi:hypothetical protein